MNIKLGFTKLTALAAACVLAVATAPAAHADGIRIGGHGGWSSHGHNRSHVSLSINLGQARFGGRDYYATHHRAYDPHYRDDYYQDSYADGDSYYYNGYYTDSYYDNSNADYGYYDPYPQVSIGYSNYGGGYGYGNGYGYDHRRDRDHWDRDRDNRDHRHGDHDSHQYGGWDRDHYYNDQGASRDHGASRDQGASRDGHRHRRW